MGSSEKFSSPSAFNEIYVKREIDDVNKIRKYTKTIYYACGMAGTPPINNEWTLNLDELLVSLKTAAKQSFSIIEAPSNKAPYTIKNFNCGWETDTSENYTFNISNITLNKPTEKESSSTSTAPTISDGDLSGKYGVFLRLWLPGREAAER